MAYAVYCRIDFDGRDPKNPKLPTYKIGRGNAGYTHVTFPTREAAQAFADRLPVYARVPNHGVWEV